ncbi:hypothetical protein DICPUDRAFT_85603 [Dictyostelium purpureum]|uniref:Uncharacterized protein n=1 Tax=Dictyostelium purpureum TaxID=5786 RepID=F1A691_DICPU|nr:uncharacterized protein DICPUDRAFT_85603 [Dictyostelium purpureum]EGC28287.1 hypothetical protein DICPUDRAFT_85603 [Dictyostelium purpureum]|eukprot:XP_003295185.1 hypothetical protein DICPUDRAFT_85603 [Dictyostelium purpureum]
MESNLINWISNCNPQIIDILVTLSNNEIFICRKNLKKIIKSPKKLFKIDINFEKYSLLKKELESIDFYFNNRNNEIILIENYYEENFIKINPSIDSSIKLLIINNFNLNQKYVKVIFDNDCNKNTSINNNDNIKNNNNNKSNINSPVPNAFENNNILNIELVPKTTLCYFDKRIPFEIVHLLSTKEYSNLISSINSIYLV